jgi:hypothetical protein
MKQTAVKYGILTGMAIMLYLFVFHLINRELALNPLVYWSPILVAVVAMTMVVKKEREMNDGKMEQRTALRHAFLTFVIAYFFFTAFIYLLFNLIDPSLIDLQKKAMLEAGRKIEGLDFRMTIGKVLFQYAYMLIPGFFLSYMVASFMKK